MLQYYRTGRPKQVADELKRMRARGGSKDRPLLTNLIQKLETIDGRWATAQEPLRMRKLDECQRIIKDAFEADAAIVPHGFKSVLVKEMSSELAKAFFDAAKDELAQEHLDKAFKNVYEGYKLDPLNTDLAGALGYMEREANLRIAASPNCDSYQFALSITRPQSRPHQQALEAAKRAGCKLEKEGTQP